MQYLSYVCKGSMMLSGTLNFEFRATCLPDGSFDKEVADFPECVEGRTSIIT